MLKKKVIMDLYYEYDEILQQNEFYKKLQSEHKIILDTAPLENWVICIPRQAIIRPEHLSNPNFLLAHILIPNDELPQTHFNNLLGTDIKLHDKQLSILVEESLDQNTPTTSTEKTSMKLIESMVLFEEVFYTKGLMKYKVWCIETPLLPDEDKLLGQGQGNRSSPHITTTMYVVRDLKDAIEMIWNETNSKAIFRKIDNACTQFIVSHSNQNKSSSRLKRQELCDNSTENSLSNLRESAEQLYNQCLQAVLNNKRLKEKCRQDMHLFKILKIALETYMMSVLYEHIFDGIVLRSAEEGERFNRILRSLAECNLSYMNVDGKYMDIVACVRVELIKMEKYATAIEKLGKFKKIILFYYTYYKSIFEYRSTLFNGTFLFYKILLELQEKWKFCIMLSPFFAFMGLLINVCIL